MLKLNDDDFAATIPKGTIRAATFDSARTESKCRPSAQGLEAHRGQTPQALNASCQLLRQLADSTGDLAWLNDLWISQLVYPADVIDCRNDGELFVVIDAHKCGCRGVLLKKRHSAVDGEPSRYFVVRHSHILCVAFARDALVDDVSSACRYG